MSRLDELPPDQRATLSLLLSRGKSYAEVSSLLGISPQAVADRAHGALAVLAPAQARALTPESRREIGDYLLSQQPGVAERLRTRTELSTSEPARLWASAIARELAPLSSTGLPEIPAPAPAAQSTPLREQLSANTDPAPAASAAAPSSKLGGALLLGGIAVVIVAAILILSANNGSGSKHSSTTSTTSTTTKGPKVIARVAMTSPHPGSRSVGLVDVLEESGKRAFYIAAENLPPSKGFFYAIWLYNSPHHAEAVSKSPEVTSNKKLAGGALLPSNAAEYHTMLLTRETQTVPTHPGPVVLHGALNLPQ